MARHGRPRPPRRRLGQVVAACAVVLGVGVLAAAPASAHAELESTDPGQSAVLAVSPHQVVLHFDEPVEIEFGSLWVFDSRGRRLDEGGTHHPGGDARAVAVGLPARLPAGTYIVAWRVVSDDSHPVQGGFVFSVGSAAGAGRAESVEAALASAGSGSAVGALYGVLRFLTFASLLVLVGLTAGAVVLWPGALALRRVRTVLWASWAVLLVATVAAVPVQGVYASMLPAGRLVSPSLSGEVLRTRFGEVQMLRVALLVAALPAIVSLRRVAAARRPLAVGAGAAVGLGLLLTPGLAGHASTTGNGVVGEALDVVHLGAAATWLGGLVLLGLLLLPRRRPAPAAPGVGLLARRFSPVAVGAVALVVATGSAQSVRNVGSRYALFHTPYGRILLVKVALVAVLVALGAVTRRRAARGAERLPRAVAAEILAFAMVLGATSLLVNAEPARQAAAAPFTRSFEVLGLEVNAVVAPARAGTANAFHFYVLGRSGAPVAVPELDASISLRHAGAGPIALALTVAGPGHYQASGITIPAAGDWELRVTVRTSATDERELRATVPVH